MYNVSNFEDIKKYAINNLCNECTKFANESDFFLKEGIKHGHYFARKCDRNGKQNQKIYVLPVFSVPAHQNYDRI